MIHYNAVIDDKLCINCEICFNICQQNYPLELKEPIRWYQGWASNDIVRGTGSSGGIAGALSHQFIKNGGIVFSCIFMNGQFIYTSTENIDEIKKFSGSKYVKSNPKGIYRKIKEELKKNKNVLVIGLPCHIAAVKKFIGNEYINQLYTVDLICHGTPSPNVLKEFLIQYGIHLEDVSSIKFRKKNSYRLEIDHKLIENIVIDKYMISFLDCITFTENCYKCYYAKKERVSDITIGDSWGSNLSQEYHNGISLIICQTEKALKLVDECEIVLKEVDIDNAISYNAQLSSPSIKPKGRDGFFRGLTSKLSFNILVWKTFPIKCFKQIVKKILVYGHILKYNQ